MVSRSAKCLDGFPRPRDVQYRPQKTRFTRQPFTKNDLERPRKQTQHEIRYAPQKTIPGLKSKKGQRRRARRPRSPLGHPLAGRRRPAPVQGHLFRGQG